MRDDGERMKIRTEKKISFRVSTKEFFCAGLLSFHFQSKRSVVSFE